MFTELTFKIYGNPITKKNSMQIIRVNGRPVPIQSAQYRRYESDAVAQIIEQIGTPDIDYPVNISCTYYMQTRRKVDLTNLLSATHDVLVRARTIKDDNTNIVVGVDGSRVYYDKENPRCEVTICELLPFEE